MTDPRRDFFISYNKADADWAEWIAWQLENAGFRVVIQAWDFKAGNDFVLEMDRAANECERTVAVLSPNYLAGLFTKPEWATAFARDPTGERRVLIPVRVQPCDVGGLLKTRIYIDLVDKAEDACRRALLDEIGGQRKKPPCPPGFPGSAASASPVTGNERGFPGALPPIANLPFQRNPNFTGRDAILRDLRAALTEGKAVSLVQAIHGLGGIGKTQTALEYAYRYGGTYALLWWVRAEQPETLTQDMAALATALNLPYSDLADQTAVAGAARRHLEKAGNWLLIFDNAVTPESVRPFVPNGHGHVLVTSRNPNWGGLAQPVPINRMASEEAVRFLLTRTGQTDHDAAHTLAAELGELPLAMEQAGAFIEEGGLSLARYLAMFRNHQLKLLEKGRPGTEYPHSVATTWTLSFEAACRVQPAAADLMNLLAFLAPEALPLATLRDGADALPSPLREAAGSDLDLPDVVGALRRYSLVTAERDEISVHRLVQAVTRDRLDANGQRQWLEAAVRLLRRTFPDEAHDFRYWPAARALLAHAMVAADRAAKIVGVPPQESWWVLNRIGRYLTGRGLYDQAAERLTQAEANVQQQVPLNELGLAECRSDLAAILNRRGRYREALVLNQQALEVRERILGPEHTDVALSLNNFAGTLRLMGQPGAAQPLYERALTIREGALCSDLPEIARLLGNLAATLGELGQPGAARPLAERAVGILEAALGPDHPDVATALVNLGGTLSALGQPRAARPLDERALRIREVSFGLDHPDVARSHNNLGMLLAELGNLPAARVHLLKADQIARKTLGPDHPDAQLYKRNLRSVMSLGHRSRRR